MKAILSLVAAALLTPILAQDLSFEVPPPACLDNCIHQYGACNLCMPNNVFTECIQKTCGYQDESCTCLQTMPYSETLLTGLLQTPQPTMAPSAAPVDMSRTTPARPQTSISRRTTRQIARLSRQRRVVRARQHLQGGRGFSTPD